MEQSAVGRLCFGGQGPGFPPFSGPCGAQQLSDPFPILFPYHRDLPPANSVSYSPYQLVSGSFRAMESTGWNSERFIPFSLCFKHISDDGCGSTHLCLSGLPHRFPTIPCPEWLRLRGSRYNPLQFSSLWQLPAVANFFFFKTFSQLYLNIIDIYYIKCTMLI